MTPTSLRHRIGRAVTSSALAVVLVAASCGGDTGDAATGPDLSTFAEPGPTDLPEVTVTDIATGAPVELRSLPSFGADRPLLLWFWAPH